VLLGKPCALFKRPEPIVTLTLAWLLYNTSHLSSIRTSIGSIKVVQHLWYMVCAASFEVFRVANLTAWFQQSRLVYNDPGVYWPSLILGGLGGCGGVFMPLSKGLSPLENNIPYNVRTAFLGSCLYYASTRYGASSDESRVVVALVLILLRFLPNSAVTSTMSLIDSFLSSLLGVSEHPKTRTKTMKEKLK